MVLRDHATNYNHYIFTTTVSMATKLGGMVIYLERLLIIKLYKDLITWLIKITWQAKTRISLLWQYLWPLNLARWWHTMKSFLSKSYMNFQSRGFVKSRDILNALHFHLHYTSSHQTWEGGESPWRASPHKFT